MKRLLAVLVLLLVWSTSSSASTYRKYTFASRLHGRDFDTTCELWLDQATFSCAFADKEHTQSVNGGPVGPLTIVIPGTLETTNSGLIMHTLYTNTDITVKVDGDKTPVEVR